MNVEQAAWMCDQGRDRRTLKWFYGHTGSFLEMREGRACELERSRLDWDVGIWRSKLQEPFPIPTCKLRCRNSCFSVTGCWLFINHVSRQTAH